MSREAVGIHAHPNYKTGRRPPKNAPALDFARYLTGQTPEHPVAADHFAAATFGLYGNDHFGVCGPTSVCNLVRLVTRALLGTQIEPSQDDCFDLYRRSGNPDFDPTTGAGDNGVDMQTMLEALLSGGVGDGKGGNVKPICFAKLDVAQDAVLDATVSIVGGDLWGVNLETAQQAQTNAQPPKWDYQQSDTWGGHAVLNGKYDESTQDGEVISWELDVQTTSPFRRQQLEEGWVVVWQWNLDHPAFQAGVDLNALRADYQELTGQTLAT